MKEIDALREEITKVKDENSRMRNDSNAATLVRRLKINVEWNEKEKVWKAWTPDVAGYAEDEDWNRAIVQCAAKARMGG